MVAFLRGSVYFCLWPWTIPSGGCRWRLLVVCRTVEGVRGCSLLGLLCVLLEACACFKSGSWSLPRGVTLLVLSPLPRGPCGNIFVPALANSSDQPGCSSATCLFFRLVNSPGAFLSCLMVAGQFLYWNSVGFLIFLRGLFGFRHSLCPIP